MVSKRIFRLRWLEVGINLEEAGYVSGDKVPVENRLHWSRQAVGPARNIRQDERGKDSGGSDVN